MIKTVCRSSFVENVTFLLMDLRIKVVCAPREGDLGDLRDSEGDSEEDQLID